MSDDTALDALRQVALFAGLDPEAVSSVAHAVTRRDVPVGSVLIAQGDPGDALYVVLRGRLIVEMRGEDGVVRRLSEIGAGELVGEMAISPRSRVRRRCVPSVPARWSS
jgi:CRP-like cAMP-binding protein